MKACYSATIWDDSRSGIGTYISEQIALLSCRQDLDVCFLEYGGKLLSRDQRPGTSGTSHGVSKRLRPLRDILWHRYQLASLVRKEGIELVHVPTIRRIPGKLPCPTVLTVHDLGPVRMQGKYGALRSLYHSRVVPRWLEEVDAIVTPSQFTKNDLIRFYRVPDQKITVVPNGLNHDLYHPGDPAESREVVQRKYRISGPFFVYISRLEHPAKNHVRLIQAFERFKGMVSSPHQLVLVGAKWNGFEKVEAAMAASRCRDSVVHTDYVPREDLPHFLRASSALIYPSLFEGFGMPVTEAMACGTPVACSRSSSLTEIAEGKGLLFDPENIEEMSDAIQQLATDAALGDRLRQAGLEHARSFTWARSVDETVRVWRRTLEEHV